ncbi:putative ammonium transporter 1 [Dendronephthya gigantea]|uniref:putative ammonium transporter 1 n=1 Tax=Dendronephthya gigantea TaxID=151771 RepID=UPI00106AE223|nr:putative ammonium transporter 1 [Dendronephthya gigantea]
MTLESNLNQFFLIVNGFIVLFMQAGFAFLEAGSVRSKNTTNILIKNTLDLFCGATVYWLVGYSFAFGGDGDKFKGNGDAFIGHDNFALSGLDENDYAKWFFQFVFAATAATIVSGAIAERAEFIAYLVYSALITGFVYPVVTHWAWSDHGWLIKSLEDDDIVYQDFAGSGVVHMVGGMLALTGAIAVGPRIGRFEGDDKTLLGHTVPMVSLGGFILFFGFLAFNGGSQGSISKDGDAAVVALAIVNTILSGAGGAIMAMIIKRIATGFFNGHWSLLTTINGGLAGMVCICAGCNNVHPWAGFVIGLVAGVVFMAWSFLIEKMKIDDPLDAVAVHYGAGFWGVIAVTLFNKESGVFYDWDELAFKRLGWNLLGAIVISAWSLIWGLIIFMSLKLFKILRVPSEIEIKGLDVPKHGEPAYPYSSYGDGWGENPPKVNGNSNGIGLSNRAGSYDISVTTH